MWIWGNEYYRDNLDNVTAIYDPTLYDDLTIRSKPMRVKWFSDKGLSILKALSGEEHYVFQTVDKDGKKAMYGMWLGSKDLKTTANYTTIFGAAPKSIVNDMLELDVQNERIEDFACLKAGTVYLYAAKP